ncbi:hypothetical protein DRE_04580 [Drechslerella stenobrocha 248]|uniref:Uncharacterized protein n=1 Tax=Drechslerella stenobrocha 248 TaxID=1043628 RepID=W7I107_9PEZI|nr:hypothetical protein DRE_04580 [Drechslerella stenobrocha 248]
MRFSACFILTIASLAFNAASFPTVPTSNQNLDIVARNVDTTPLEYTVDMVKRSEIEPKVAEVIEKRSTQKRSPEDTERDPAPFTGSDYNKRSAMPQNDDTDQPPGEAVEAEPEVIVPVKRITGQIPGAGIPQGLGSGIAIFMIIFMLFAMITAISVKDTD